MIWLAIIVGIVLFIVSSRQKTSAAGPNSLRRLFIHFLLFGLVMAATSSLADLVALLIGRETFDRTQDLASALATLTVTVPVSLGIGRTVLRKLRDDSSGERESVGWNLYLGAVLLVSLAWTAGSGTAVGIGLMAGTEISKLAIAAIPVWGLLYASHRWLRARYGDASQQSLETVAGSALGLGFAWVGAALTITWAVDRILLSDVITIAQAGRDVPVGVVPLAIGGLIWWQYWLRHGVDLNRTTAWQVLVIMVGSVLALASALVSLGWALFRAAEWFVGDPLATFEAQFETLPALLGVGLVGVVVWWYHRTLLTGGERVTGTVREVATYVMAGLALAAVVVAVTILIIAVLVSVFGTGDVSTLSDTDVVLGAVVALAVALPTWWLYWSPIRTVSVEQARSVVRRGYLIAIFGVGGVVAIGALIALLFELFQAGIDGSFTAATFAGLREPIAVLGAVGLVAWYHWTIWRLERPGEQEAAETRPPGPTVLLVGFTRHTAHDLREVTGGRVIEASFGDRPLVDGDVGAIETLIGSDGQNDVIVLAQGTEVRVLHAQAPAE